MHYYPCYNSDTGEIIGFLNPDAWARAALNPNSNEHEASSNYTMNTWHQRFYFMTTQSTLKNGYKNSDHHFSKFPGVKLSSVGTNTGDEVSYSGLRESTTELRKLLGLFESLECGVDAASPPTMNVHVQEQKEERNWRDLLNCKYCRQNGEEEVFYNSHALRDQRGVLMCPILMQQTCPHCLATGGNSHDPSHCPLNKSMVSAAVMQSDPEPKHDEMKTPSDVETHEDGFADVNDIDCDVNTKVGRVRYGVDRAEVIAARIRRRLEKRKQRRLIRCVYCRYHAEGKKISRSHVVKDENGLVLCPILKQHVCPMCFATGALAHTIEYCPYYIEWKNEPKNRFQRLRYPKFQFGEN